MPLTRLERMAFGCGHVFNDLCASMWFTYLITYMINVLKFNMGNAGNLMIIGQVADGLSTTFVGFESDRTGAGGLRGYGRRKTWHAVGTLCVLVSFPFIFNPIPGPQRSSEWAMLVYYAPFIVLFQFGWAAVQNSHLSLIPQLAETEACRIRLNSIRFAFTVFSNIMVYTSAFLLLRFNEVDNGSDQLSPADAQNFLYLVLMVTGAGCIFSLMFHLFVKEPRQQPLQPAPQEPAASINGDEDSAAAAGTPLLSEPYEMSTLDWLREPQFYAIGALYMLTRLIINVAQVYLPLLVTESYDLHKAWIAIVPLAVYFTSMLTSLLLETCHAIGKNRKIANLIGLALIGGFSASAYLVHPNIDVPWQLTLPAVSLGAGSSIIMIMSMALTADLIGADRNSSAFVYGCMSLVDKLANGITVWVAQHIQPHIRPGCEECRRFFRSVEGFWIGGFAAAAFLLTLALLPVKVGQRRARRRRAGTVGSDYGSVRNSVNA